MHNGNKHSVQVNMAHNEGQHLSYSEVVRQQMNETKHVDKKFENTFAKVRSFTAQAKDRSEQWNLEDAVQELIRAKKVTKTKQVSVFTKRAPMKSRATIMMMWRT